MTVAGPHVSVVIVTYHSARTIARTLPALARELTGEDEVLVVDNASSDGSAAVARALLPAARVIETGANLGFAAASNVGAAAARRELIVFLNPDAVPQPGWGRAIRAPARDGRGWVAWQALATAEAGRVINTAGNVVHFTGVGWAGQAGRPVADAALAPQEVGCLSGACLAVRAEAFRAVGGFPADFFLYFEDTDLSLRLRLAGGRLGLEPTARVEHDYAFAKGGYKWRLLERNRWATLVRCWPGALLGLVAPALLATEAAIWASALSGGWAPEKARACAETARRLPRLLRERRAIQAARRIDAGRFAAGLTAELSSPFLGRASRSRLLARGLALYWWGVRALLPAPRKTR